MLVVGTFVLAAVTATAAVAQPAARKARVTSETESVVETGEGDGSDRAASFGPQVDRSQFRFQRRLPIAPAGPALLPLDAHVLARPRGLSDVRLVDDSGRQVPYVVERPHTPVVVELAVPARQATERASRYRFPLPFETWPAGSQLVLTTGARLFERTVTVRREADSHRNRREATLARVTWRSTDPQTSAAPLVINVASRRGHGALDVIVDEGDNAPLPIESAQLRMPAAALRFHHPGIPLALVYGTGRIRAPRYDLALLPPQDDDRTPHVMALPPLLASNYEEEEGRGRKVFWIGIAIAAIVLIAMLARLLRPETSRAPNDST